MQPPLIASTMNQRVDGGPNMQHPERPRPVHYRARTETRMSPVGKSTRRKASSLSPSRVCKSGDHAAFTANGAQGHSHASVEFTIQILQGQDLAACDTNIFGKATSSDPYVLVALIPSHSERLVVGTTKTKTATLNPKWDETLFKTFPPGSFKSDHYTLQLTLMDYDLIGDDDCMGVVRIPMTLESGSQPARWYEIPPKSAANAQGRIQIAIETKVHWDAFLPQPQYACGVLGTAAHTFLEAGTAVAGLGLEGATAVAGLGLEAGTFAVEGAATAAGATADLATTAAKKTKMMGLMPTNFCTKKKKTAAMLEADKYENIYKEEPCLSLQVTVHQGDGLVAKDRNALGLKTTSDPYIVLEVWPKGIPLETPKDSRDYPKIRFGRSPTQHKTLSPVWNHSFEAFNVALDPFDREEAQLRIRILDDDYGIGDDDPMGSIDIYLQPHKQLEISEKWYHVSATSATRASGRVQISLMTLHSTQKTVIGRKKKPSIIPERPKEPVLEKPVEDEDAAEDEEELARQAEVAAALLLVAERERIVTAKSSRLRKATSQPELARTRHSPRQSRRTVTDGSRREREHRRTATESRSSRRIKEGRRSIKSDEGRRTQQRSKKSRRHTSPKITPRRQTEGSSPKPRRRTEVSPKRRARSERVRSESSSPKPRRHTEVSPRRRARSERALASSSHKSKASATKDKESSRRVLEKEESKTTRALTSWASTMDTSAMTASSRHGDDEEPTTQRSPGLNRYSSALDTSAMSASARNVGDDEEPKTMRGLTHWASALDTSAMAASNHSVKDDEEHKTQRALTSWASTMDTSAMAASTRKVRDEEEEEPKKKLSKSGRSGKSMRTKEMQASKELNSSRRSVDAIPKESASSRQPDEDKKRISRSGRTSSSRRHADKDPSKRMSRSSSRVEGSSRRHGDDKRSDTKKSSSRREKGHRSSDSVMDASGVSTSRRAMNASGVSTSRRTDRSSSRRAMDASGVSTSRRAMDASGVSTSRRTDPERSTSRRGESNRERRKTKPSSRSSDERRTSRRAKDKDASIRESSSRKKDSGNMPELKAMEETKNYGAIASNVIHNSSKHRGK